MRPGMPPGRKHFRRSRDAPIFWAIHAGIGGMNGAFRKGLVTVLIVKELLLQ